MNALVSNLSAAEQFQYANEVATSKPSVPAERILGLQHPIRFHFIWPDSTPSVDHGFDRSPDDLQSVVVVVPDPFDENKLNTLRRYYRERVAPEAFVVWRESRILDLLNDCPSLCGRYDPALEFDKILTEYREALILFVERVVVAGLPAEVVHTADPMHRHLQDIFVPLSLIKDSGKGRHVPLSVAIQTVPNALLTASVGSGKTTLLRYVAAVCAGRSNRKGLEFSVPTVPLFLRLRHITPNPPTAGHRVVAHELAAQARSLGVSSATPLAFESVLRVEDAFLLVDGADEAPNREALDGIFGEVRDLAQRNRSLRVWVTTRPSVPAATLKKLGFPQFRIADLDDTQFGPFVANWYPVLGASADSVPERVRRLAHDISRNPAVRRFARSPLLLTLLAFLHGRQPLPTSRAALFAKCSEVYLKLWPAVRTDSASTRPHAGVEPPTSYDEYATRYLSRIAFSILESAGSGAFSPNSSGTRRRLSVDSLLHDTCSIDRQRACELLAPIFLRAEKDQGRQATTAMAEVEVGRFLDYVRDRTGLLVESGGRISFVHAGFQDYYAARLICDSGGRIDEFRKRISNPIWEDVCITVLDLENASTRDFDDRNALIAAAMNLCASGTPHAAQTWFALLRVIAERVTVSQAHRAAIVGAALDFWISKSRDETRSTTGGPDDTQWVDVFEDITEPDDDASKVVRGLLLEGIEGSSPVAPIFASDRAVGAAYLCAHLFAKKPETLQRLARAVRGRQDYPVIRRQIVGLIGLNDLLMILDDAPIEEWMNALESLDSEDGYRALLKWVLPSGIVAPRGALLGAISFLWRKIYTELKSRDAFRSRFSGSAGPRVSEDGGSLTISVRDASLPRFEVHVPLSGLRCAKFLVPLVHPRAPQRLAMRRLARYVLANDRTLEDISLTPLAAWMTDLITEIISSRGGFIANHSMVGLHDLCYRLMEVSAEALGGGLFESYNQGEGLAGGQLGAFMRNLIGFRTSVIGSRVGISEQEFVKKFTGLFARAFVSNFGTRVAPNFSVRYQHLFGREFLESFDPSEYSADYEALRRFVPGRPGIPTLAMHEFLQSVYFHSTKLDVGPGPRGEVVAKTDNVYLAPVVWLHVAVAAVGSLLLSLGRHLATLPLGAASPEEGRRWVLAHPLDVFGAGLNWAAYVRQIRNRQKTLDGPEGSLVLTLAAYTALVSGIVCRDPDWLDLISRRNQQDPLVVAAYALYQICTFQDDDKYSTEWRTMMATPHDSVEPLIAGAGIGEGPQLPKRLIGAHTSRQLTIFVGSGLSLGSGFPSWTELPDRILNWSQEHGTPDSQVVDALRGVLKCRLNLEARLALMEVLRASMVRGSWADAFRDIFLPDSLVPGAAHLAVIKVGTAAILTTNYDHLLETADSHQERVSYTWKEAAKALGTLKSKRKILLKVHGSARDHESIIATNTDYNRVQNDVSYKKVLEYLLQESAFLFVGYGMNDPLDIDLALRGNADAFKDSARGHFALLHKPTDETRDRLQRDYNVEVIPYTDHASVAPFLESLATAQ